MRPRSRLIRLFFVLLAWSLAGASPVRAAGRFVAPAAGATLEAGATVRVAWELPETEAEAGRFDEMELVLSLDGGRTFPIRVTRDLDQATRFVSLRVPALPVQDARLALRAGEGDEPDTEEILLVSDSFSIDAGAGIPLEQAVQVRGEWRTRETLGGTSPEQPAGPDCLAKEQHTIGSLPAMPPAAPPRTELARTASLGGRVCPEEPAPQLPQEFCLALSRVPTAAPMRL